MERPMTTEQRKRTLVKKEQQRQHDRLACENELRRLNAYKNVMGTEDGRAVLIDIIRRTDPIKGEHEKNNGKASYNFGRQSVGKEIIKAITEAGCKLQAADLSNTLDTNRTETLKRKIQHLISK